jgi:AhpD family alkylhydroperoxidase
VGHHHDALKEIGSAGLDLRKHIPAVYAGFGELHRAALAGGEIDAVTKELMALAISVALECDGCIASHARGAVRQGATEGQVAGAIGVAILMSGGPGTVYGPRAWEAYREFAEGS